MTKRLERRINCRMIRGYYRNRIRAIHLKRLPNDWGTWESSMHPSSYGAIEIDTHNFHRFVVTLVHEALHDMFPAMSHRKVDKIAARIVKYSNKHDIAFFLRRFVKLMKVGKNGPNEPG